MKNILFFALSLITVFLFIQLRESNSELEKMAKEHQLIEDFGIILASWDSGEKILSIHRINGFSIGFAIDKNGDLFWSNISKRIPIRSPVLNELSYLSALGNCKNGNLAARPGNCDAEIGFGAYKSQPFIQPIVNLFDYAEQ